MVGEKFSPVPLTLDHPVSKGDLISVVEYSELTTAEEESMVFEVVGIQHVVGETLTELCDPYLYLRRAEQEWA